MFKIYVDKDGNYEWYVEIPMSKGDYEPAKSESEAVQQIKDWLKELGKHAFRNDFGGVEVKYTVVSQVEEEKQSETEPPPGTEGGKELPGGEQTANEQTQAETQTGDPGGGPTPEGANTEQGQAGTQTEQVPDLGPVNTQEAGGGANAENIQTGPASSVD